MIEAGQAEAPLYDAAIDALAVLHAEAPPAILQGGELSWPLLDYDAVALGAASEVFLEWLPKFDARVVFGDEAAARWREIWAPIEARGEAGATVFCHRDYHAENLLWLPKRDGPARVGMIDFQDAVRAHPAWDLSMLLHDARRDVSPERQAAALERYLAEKTPDAREALIADFNALGALNIVRILGVFARLVTRDGKPRYAAFMPRLWGYLDRVTAHPDLAPLKAFLDDFVPVEVRR